MSSLFTILNSSTAQDIVNSVTTADGCVHTVDRTQLDFAVGKFVQTRRGCRQLVANCVHTADTTRQLSRVGGVYWAYESSHFFQSNVACEPQQTLGLLQRDDDDDDHDCGFRNLS